MAIPEAVMVKLAIMGADIASDIIMDIVAEKRNAGEATITVAELELMALKYKRIKDEETQKIRDRIQAAEGGDPVG